MKRLILALITTSMFAACGSAFAAGDNTLEPVIIHSGTLAVDCTPPTAEHVCNALHAQIRQNFSPREISLLFGARTSFANYSAEYPHLVARYDAFLRDQAIAAYAQPRTTSVAAK